MNDVSPTASPDERHRLLKWKRDIILATSPATTGNSEDMPLHLIVLAMLKLHTHNPRLDRSARVDAAGNVSAWHFEDTKRERALVGRRVTVGKIGHVNDALRRLADHCKLSDPDRQAMFDAFKSWIGRDDRANDTHKERVN